MNFHNDIECIIWHGVNHLVECETSYIACQNEEYLMNTAGALTIVDNVIDLAVLSGIQSEMGRTNSV
jgi:hypothetical protein